MQYELWQDTGDDRYCIIISTKYMWLDAIPLTLDMELYYWDETSWDDSTEDMYKSLNDLKLGEMSWRGDHATFAGAYEQYRMEHLLNA